MEKRVAIITARGGSKRIPRKNIREFCGKPIIAYSIEAAIESRLFDRVMVSTDDNEIAEISKCYGATVPFYRSEATSNDFADTTDVLNEVLDRLREDNEIYDEMCCIYPTAPFITKEKLIDSHKLLTDEKVCNVVPMVPFSFPPQRGMVLDDRGCLKPQDPASINMRSQDLQQILHDVGQFYWFKVEEFLKNPEFLCNNTKPYIVSELEMQDIDNDSDWALAEIKYRFLMEAKVYLS